MFPQGKTGFPRAKPGSPRVNLVLPRGNPVLPWGNVAVVEKGAERYAPHWFYTGIRPGFALGEGIAVAGPKAALTLLFALVIVLLFPW